MIARPDPSPPPQLEPYDAAGVARKSSEVAPGRSEPKQRLVRHNSICKYRYTLSNKLKKVA